MASRQILKWPIAIMNILQGNPYTGHGVTWIGPEKYRIHMDFLLRAFFKVETRSGFKTVAA